ncbi:hypothetical protein L3X38_026830 [Prunus dulcis]|uniref:Uncharacterized protein n=1 Tax=Prunus dulcis TaxID=3755 RepID=A0AAD4VLS6_PRUDU|nr:hypothetical protein L3X38_026830 [Prunus dulcis]
MLKIMKILLMDMMRKNLVRQRKNLVKVREASVAWQDGEDEQGGEDEEENGDFIDSEFEQSDEEDNMNFHKYVVTEEQDDEYKERGEVETDDYNTSDLDSFIDIMKMKMARRQVLGNQNSSSTINNMTC